MANNNKRISVGVNRTPVPSKRKGVALPLRHNCIVILKMKDISPKGHPLKSVPG
jgi:hypothetical protein